MSLFGVVQCSEDLSRGWIDFSPFPNPSRVCQFYGAFLRNRIEHHCTILIKGVRRLVECVLLVCCFSTTDFPSVNDRARTRVRTQRLLAVPISILICKRFTGAKRGKRGKTFQLVRTKGVRLGSVKLKWHFFPVRVLGVFGKCFIVHNP